MPRPLPVILAIAVSLTPSLFAQDRADLPPDKLAAKAKALVAALAKSDFKSAAQDFDTAMQKALPPDKLEMTWKAVLMQAGDFQRQTTARAERVNKFQVVTVTCQFTRMPLDIRIVFDAAERVTGLFFRPTQPPPYHAPDYVQCDAFEEIETKIGEGEWVLPATLSLPVGNGPFSAALLVHGSGPHDRDETIGPNRPFRDLAWGLASRGIAVLRYEKRTREHAAKLAKRKDITVNEEVIDDAVAAVKYLRRKRGIDPRKIVLVGHSLGGMLAPCIAEREPRIEGLVLLAAPARPLEDLIVEQMTYIHSLDGPLTDEQRSDLEKLKNQAARVKAPKLGPHTPAADLPLGLPASYWLSLRQADPLKAAARIKQPILVLQAGRDYQVTRADAELWAKALSGRKSTEIRTFGELNHLFMAGRGKSKPAEYLIEGHVAADVIESIATWVKKR